jgi:hypothetical protein
MPRYEKQQPSMSRSKAWTILIIFIMGIWVKNLYDDIDWARGETGIYKTTIEQKDLQIISLIKIIDSLTTKPVIVTHTVQPKPVTKPMAIKTQTFMSITDTLKFKSDTLK